MQGSTSPSPRRWRANSLSSPTTDEDFRASRFDGTVDDEHRLETDAADAYQLITSKTDSPAYVFGSSSGAIVGIELRTRHPNRVRKLVAHEPPIVTLLPDGEHYRELFDDVYQTYRRQGIRRAMRKFIAIAGAGPPRIGRIEFLRMLPLMARIRRNMGFWLQHELRQYTSYHPDIAVLQSLSGQLVLAGGEESSQFFPYRPNTVLADLLDMEVVDFPGGHAGYRAYSAEFARRLIEAFRD